MAKKGTGKAETYAVCEAIIKEATKINEIGGHMIVFTSPEDKSALGMAKQLHTELKKPTMPRKAASPGGKRFSEL